MPILIPFLVGAGGTGWLWWKKSAHDKAKAQQKAAGGLGTELLTAAKVVGGITAGVFVIQWVYTKAAKDEN